MRPRLENRRVAKVNANLSWDFALRHRVYSCPDTAGYGDELGATALILTNGAGRRVPLAVSAVVRLAPDDPASLDALDQALRTRLHDYQEAAAVIPGIMRQGVTHRFYFLDDEPWPDWLQALTTPNRCPDSEWAAILSICTEPDRFFEWPQVGELLWPGCTRGDANQVHHYPVQVADRLLKAGIHQPDRRNNGPAIMALLAAGGRRPIWGSEGWPIHHIYDGTAPIIGDPPVVRPKARGGLHAVNDDHYFTHSGGLVAAHPVAHHLAHQSTLLKWLLRREAFLRFGFDPDTSFL